ncbi:acetylglutamate kinase [Bacillus sp. LL01]|uniref:acetylglutamate kinase n=1 Tax=Bacillus sp. LL01 TaxID=1665556 RepID=UPI00064D09FA|nr:acetylglutamate kinase [Bacillus sp. LL01]KMJ59528.1 acetylglutamate kinase [Bacillus sp. LL01]
MKSLVIKCGGSTIEKLPSTFYTELVELKTIHDIQPIIVHGGGPSISSLLSAMKVETTFVNGLRKTTEPVLEVVEMVLSGSMNKHLVRQVMKAGGIALGISGVDGKFLIAKPISNAEELGLVGEIVEVNRQILAPFMKQGIIPIISPVAVDNQGQHYNINADLAAAAIAEAFGSPLCMVTDVDGVLVGDSIAANLSDTEVAILIEESHITGGMIPKVNAAVSCLMKGVSKVGIINGSTPDALTQFTLSECEVGTTFYLEEVMEKSV